MSDKARTWEKAYQIRTTREKNVLRTIQGKPPLDALAEVYSMARWTYSSARRQKVYEFFRLHFPDWRPTFLVAALEKAADMYDFGEGEGGYIIDGVRTGAEVIAELQERFPGFSEHSYMLGIHRGCFEASR